MNDKRTTENLLTSDRASELSFTFFKKIMRDWRVESLVKLSIMDCKDTGEFEELVGTRLPENLLIRISHLMSIYQLLALIFPSKEQAINWVNKPNAALGDITAIQFISKDIDKNLAFVHSYLESQLNPKLDNKDES